MYSKIYPSFWWTFLVFPELSSQVLLENIHMCISSTEVSLKSTPRSGTPNVYVCGGLNENGLHRLVYLYAWSLGGELRIRRCGTGDGL